MLSKYREVWRSEETRSISRRYFISNGFDGVLTGIGITVGSFLSGVPGLTVFKVALGAAVGLATSGVWSVWEIERAEKQAELESIEDAMAQSLDDTSIQRQKVVERQINAVMSGIGPVIGVIIPATPFLFLPLLQATVVSVVLGVLLLFSFGAYMSKVSKQRWYVAGVRMGLAGFVVTAINYVLPG